MMKRLALCVLASTACSSSHSVGSTPGDGGGGGVTLGNEGGATTSNGSSGGDGGAVVDARASDASTIDDASADVAGYDVAPGQPSGHVRFADWTPDAPTAGYSFCLAPQGTSTWTGPFQPQGLPFPNVAAYADVPPGDYDLQVIGAGSSDCTAGVIPTSYGLPALSDGTYATFATVGVVMPIGGDQSQKVVAFIDEVTGTPSGLMLRAIDAASMVGYAQFGTGSQATGDFSVMFPLVPFGTADTSTGDGGPTDPNGYALFGSLSGAELSAYSIDGSYTGSATASNVSLASGIAATLVLVGGENNGPPPQIMICNDVAAAAGAASPCTVYSQ
ncbi:MAG TPA: hypothetical protein VMI75_14390 [Polyangiaceae bacterium]|nr:hypothetical protein [Polyangiaceae bacterium]